MVFSFFKKEHLWDYLYAGYSSSTWFLCQGNCYRHDCSTNRFWEGFWFCFATYGRLLCNMCACVYKCELKSSDPWNCVYIVLPWKPSANLLCTAWLCIIVSQIRIHTNGRKQVKSTTEYLQPYKFPFFLFFSIYTGLLLA